MKKLKDLKKQSQIQKTSQKNIEKDLDKDIQQLNEEPAKL